MCTTNQNDQQPQHLSDEHLPPVENKNLLPNDHDHHDDNTTPGTPPFPTKKRNSGKTGPITPLGIARSAMNSLRHGGCSQTLILEGESEDAWLRLHDRWCATYRTSEQDNSLLYDFTRKTAQAEWFRIRCQHNHDLYLLSLGARSPFNWTPEEIKKHDLLLRYKNSAERSFLRENRALEQHYKLHPPPPPPEPPTPAVTTDHNDDDEDPGLTILTADPECPTGYRILCEIKDGRESHENKGNPFTPPDPLPADWPKFYFPEKAKD